jgi:hypothetical protein
LSNLGEGSGLLIREAGFESLNRSHYFKVLTDSLISVRMVKGR